MQRRKKLRTRTAGKPLGHQSHVFITSLLENLPHMVFVKDAAELRFVSMNRAGEELTGYTRDELVGRNDFDFFPKEQADFFTAKDREVLLHGTLLDISEEPILTKQKGLRFLHTKKIPILDARGRPQYLLGISEDITERKRAEENRARLAAIVESSDDAIISRTLDGTVVSWNTGAERLLGYSAGEIIGQPITTLVRPDRQHEERDSIDRVRQGETVKYPETVRLRKDGQDVHVSVTISPVKDSSGSIIGASMIARDITALREAKDRFLGIYHSSKDAIGYSSLDGRLVDVNEAFLKLTGYTQDEVLGKTYQELTPPEYREVEAAMVDQVIRTGMPVEYEKEYIRKDGLHVSVTLTAFVVKGSDGTPLGFAAIIRDVTERKRLEEQFRQAQKMEAVGQLAGGIAHDFNNLLTVINGFSDLLLARLPHEDPTRNEVEQIKEAGGRASALTAKLLAFSRKQMIQLQVLNLNEVVSGVEKLLRRLIGVNIDLVTNPAADLGYIKADPSQIEQVILNLAVNARDAMPQGGRLTIETRNVELDAAFAEADMPVQAGSYVMMSMADTGCGMDEATRARMFEPFFTTKEPGKGTGMGLATVYGIVKQRNGYISVSSQLGTGTAFALYLPRIWPEAAERGVRHPSTTLKRGSETILLVEDEPSVRAFVRDALRLSGYVVLEARHGIEAMMLSRQHTGDIQLLLTDVNMPQINGRELAERLQNERPELKVLYVSGYVDDALLRHGILTLDKVFLQKPFTADTLARKVRDILDPQS